MLKWQIKEQILRLNPDISILRHFTIEGIKEETTEFLDLLKITQDDFKKQLYKSITEQKPEVEEEEPLTEEEEVPLTEEEEPLTEEEVPLTEEEEVPLTEEEEPLTEE